MQADIQTLIARAERPVTLTLVAPGFIEAQTRRHQCAVDAAFEFGEFTNNVKADLVADMTRAMAGELNFVASYVKDRNGSVREVLEHRTHAVLGALDFDQPAAAFFAALKDSACPLVATLRDALAHAYAEQVGDEVAQARSK